MRLPHLLRAALLVLVGTVRQGRVTAVVDFASDEARPLEALSQPPRGPRAPAARPAQFRSMDLHAITEAPFASDDDVHAVLDAFRAGALPRSAWNHRAHLTAALAFARALPTDDALTATRDAILRFNAAAGIVSTPDSGYHETLTVFYMHVVAMHVVRYPAPTSIAADANALVDAWGAKDLPLRHYTASRLFSRDARAHWTPPDLLPLPTA